MHRSVPHQLPPHHLQSLHLAAEYHQAGRFSDAEALYRQVLAQSPGYPETLHRLGVLLMQTGRPEEAMPLLEQARQSEPGNAAHWLLLTQCLLEAGRPKEAKKLITEAIRKGLRHPKAEQLLERARSGRVKSTEKTSSPTRELALLEQLLSAERFAEVEVRAQAFVQRHPRVDRGWHILAMARMARGHFDAAVEPLRRAVQIKPDRPELHFKLGHSYEKIRRLDESAQAYREALKLKPDFAEAENGLLLVLQGLGNYEEAVQVCRRVLGRKPDDFPALNNLALFLHKSGRASEAVEVYRRALLRGDEFAELHANYGNALKDAGQLEEASSEYRRAIALKPDYLESRDNLLFTLNYRECGTPEEMLAEARCYGEIVAGMAAPCATHANSREPNRRLRVGLVSGDFCEHPVGYFLESVLANLDPLKLELFAYNTAYHPDSMMNSRLRASVGHWRDATRDDLDDESMVRRILDDEIDILVDLSGHTGYNRLPVFAWKPAPVQVAWLGYFATTGLSTMDYILADRWVLPPGEEGAFVERPWRLPDSYYCFTPPDANIKIGDLPALKGDGVTFGCFNNLAKLNDRVIASWAAILRAVPNSRLFLKNKALGEPAVAASIRGRFTGHGVGPERLRLEGVSPRAEYLEAFNAVDIALDPFPFPGGTTSVEGLWMGVPVLTLKGKSFIGHQGETILHSAGLGEWIAESESEYVEKAATLAHDLKYLSALRSRLRAQVLASPLFDAPRFARNLEEAFRGMWRNWCEQH